MAKSKETTDTLEAPPAAPTWPEMPSLEGKDLNDLRALADDWATEVDAFIALDEQKGLTDQELHRFNVLTRQNGGHLVELNTIIEQREQFEQQKAVARQTRALQAMGTTGAYRSRQERTAPRREFATVRQSTLKAFALNGRPQQEAAQEAFFCGHWMRAVMNRCLARGSQPEPDSMAAKSEQICNDAGFGIRAQQTIGTDADGGYLVPAPLAQTLIDNRERIGITRRVLTPTPMTSNTLRVGKRGAGLTVYAPGEATAITASKHATGVVDLTCLKRAVANQISNELNDDAIVSMTDRAVLEMARALAQQEDYELINADGTSGSPDFDETGLLTALGAAGDVSAVATHTTWSSIDDVDVMNWLGKLPSQYSENPSIICSREFYYSVLLRVAIQAGGTSMAGVIAGPPMGGMGNATYMGMPVYWTSQMPQATAVNSIVALCGDFGMAAEFGDRTGTNIAMSFDVAFLEDMVTMKATSRYDLNVHEPGDGSNAGAYVALSTAAA